MITLHDYWRSSASYRVRIALGLAGLDWQAVSVNLVEGAQRMPDHLALNPQGLVPVIEIDGLRLTQSLTIVEYLDETHGLGLLPGTPADRAHIRAIAHAIAMDIHPICNLGTARFAVGTAQGALTMEGWMQHFIAPGLTAVETMLQGGDYCWGEGVTLADICLMPQVYNARRWQVDMTNMPRIGRVIERLDQIPAFAAAHPDRQVH